MISLFTVNTPRLNVLNGEGILFSPAYNIIKGHCLRQRIVLWAKKFIIEINEISKLCLKALEAEKLKQIRNIAKHLRTV